MVDQEKQKKPPMVYAKFETVLFEFIEPLVVLLQRGKSFYVGTAMPAVGGFVDQFFVVSVTPKYLKRYLREENDLRYLFLSAQHRRFFTMKSSEIGKQRALLTPFEGEAEEDWLPEAQFFASSHTQTYAMKTVGSVDKETLIIDGNWEMEDFGSFSRKLRDLYAFEDSLTKIANDNVPPKLQSKIRKAFTGKPFRGGSSYVNFFYDLVSAQPREDRFDLSKIKYASPGHIELAGKGAIFDVLENRIENFVQNQNRLRDKYNEFHKFMSESKLLDVQAAPQRIPPTQSDELEALSKSLLEDMTMDFFDRLYELAEGNIVNTAKITLALYRRLRSASTYFAQGRVKYGD